MQSLREGKGHNLEEKVTYLYYVCLLTVKQLKVRLYLNQGYNSSIWVLIFCSYIRITLINRRYYSMYI